MKLSWFWIVSAWPVAIAACAASPDELPPARAASTASASAASDISRLFCWPCEHARDMALRDVRDLVREHARELGLVLREQDEAGVDADVAARQRERIDRGVGHREELEVLARVARGGDEPAAELVQVVDDLGIVQEGALRASLAHDRLAELALLRGREIHLRRIAEIGNEPAATASAAAATAGGWPLARGAGMYTDCAPAGPTGMTDIAIAVTAATRRLRWKGREEGKRVGEAAPHVLKIGRGSSAKMLNGRASSFLRACRHAAQARPDLAKARRRSASARSAARPRPQAGILPTSMPAAPRTWSTSAARM